MTNKTILNLKKLKSFHIHNGNYDPDIDRAIKALEQQSNMVSRSAYEQVMWERDVAIDQLKELGYELGEKITTDKDAISRQAVLELVADYDLSMGQVVKGIHALLPVNPQPKTGHWIKTISENGITSAVRCSECGFEDNRYMLFRYCPNCGTKMEVSE